MPDRKRYDEFCGLVRLHTRNILAYIDSILLNWSDAEDLFQETCLVLWQKYDDFVPGSNFLAWALRVADYKVMNFRRQQSRRATFTTGLRDVLMTEVSKWQGESPEAGLSALSGCMERLKPNDRKLIGSCYGDDQPIRQIAEALGRSPQSIHHSLRRIRNWLLECVERELRRAEQPAPPRNGILREDDGQ